MTDAFIPPAKPIIGDDEREAVDRVLRSGMVAQGPEVAAFEQEFADVLVQGRASVAVNSGTSGLHLGLLAGAQPSLALQDGQLRVELHVLPPQPLQLLRLFAGHLCHRSDSVGAFAPCLPDLSTNGLARPACIAPFARNAGPLPGGVASAAGDARP